ACGENPAIFPFQKWPQPTFETSGGPSSHPRKEGRTMQKSDAPATLAELTESNHRLAEANARLKQSGAPPSSTLTGGQSTLQKSLRWRALWLAATYPNMTAPPLATGRT